MTTLDFVFLTIFVVGLAFLAFSLLVGELGELFGGAEAGDSASSEAPFDAPEWYDPKVIAAGMVGLGGFGLIALQLEWPTAYAAFFSTVGFIATGATAFYGVLKPLSKQQYNNVLSRDTYMGKTATVKLVVSPDSFGIVEILDDNGAIVREKAYSSEGRFPEGSSVYILDVTPSAVIVMESSSYPVRKD